MNRKQRIIVSITGIVLVSLILIGLTYAYFLTRITGNTNDKSISVTTANLEIKYEDNNDVITGDKIIPGVTLPSKTFTVTNNGNSTVDYSVGLVNIINTFTNTKDVVYNVTCTSYKKTGFKLNTDGTVTGTVSGTCSGVDETEFPTLNNYIVNNNIDVNIVHAYTITVTYKETGTDQSIDMNKTLEAKIDIFDPKSLTIKGNVTNSSENDYVVIHSKEQESNIINGKYQFIGITPDNHTISIKNRDTTTSKDTTLNVSKGTPNVSSSNITYNNEKNIADMDINVSNSTITLDVTKIGDGTYTLGETILTSAKAGGTNRTVMGTTVTEFTSISGENERVLNNAPDDYGTSYYYRGNVLDNYVSFADKLWRIVRINGDGSIRLILNDIIKGEQFNTYSYNKNTEDNAYVGYMYGTPGSTTYDDTHKNINDSNVKQIIDTWYETNIKEKYDAYLSDTLFCGDKSLKSGTGIKTEYSVYGHNGYTLKCAENATNDYSRYTVNVSTLLNENKTNGDLKYPIALLSNDEITFAGGFKYKSSINMYLYTLSGGNSSSDKKWFTMSPYAYNSNSENSRLWLFSGVSSYLYDNSIMYSYSLHPVINLKSNVVVNNGDGTIENPYTLS